MKLNDAIQNTMLIPLWSRSQASIKYPEILVDQQAIDVVRTLDHDFTSIAAAFNDFAAMSHLVRAKSMDDSIRAYTAAYPKATVVDIGAGLDTNFSRVDNGVLRWFDLDLPEALDFRNNILPKSERTTQIPKSVFDTSWFDDIDFSHEGGAIFIAAGVFYFFHQEEIRGLIVNMAEFFSGGELVFDANSSEALAVSNEMMQKSGNTGALMYFSVDDPSIFETWSPTIKVKYAGSRFEKVPRLPQMPEETIAHMKACDENNMILQIHLVFE